MFSYCVFMALKNHKELRGTFYDSSHFLIESAFESEEHLKLTHFQTIFNLIFKEIVFFPYQNLVHMLPQCNSKFEILIRDLRMFD